MVSKEALIVAGPNGAGKTTFALEYVAEHPQVFLSADAIAARLNPMEPTKARVQAGRVFFAELEAVIQRGERFVVESTLAGLGFGRVLARLKQVGYTVTIAFLFLETPAACIARVEERVRGGGHDVPKEDIVRRYYRSKQNFWNVYRHRADRWQLFHNTAEGFERVASGQRETYTVSNEYLFRSFLDDLIDNAGHASS